MSNDLWVYISLKSGKPDSLSEALLAKAQELSEENGFELCAVLVGRGTFDAAKELAERGVPKVYFGKNDSVSPCEYMRVADILQRLVNEERPEILLFPASDSASLTASTLGARLNTGVNVHCISATIRDRIFIGAVPAFGGQMMSEILCPIRKPQMATVRLNGGSFKQERPGTVVEFDAACEEMKSMRLICATDDSADASSLSDAEVAVCCGAGMADAEGWELTKKLAERLNGAACCTRNALDMQCGAREEDMVGISGSTISPKVYIGFGVSGSGHHVCGMRDSGLVLNVNRDASNPFFKASDCGFVGDAKKVAQALLEILG